MPKLDGNAEYLDDDAIWHLIFGKSAPPAIHKVCFITEETLFEKFVDLFAAVVCAIHRADLLPNAERLHSGPGELFILYADGNIGHMDIAKLIEGYLNKPMKLPMVRLSQ